MTQLTKSKQQGFSLVELIIASSLSLFLLSVLITCYLSIKRSYQFHEALQQIKDTGIIATQLISDDIRHAGMPGCLANNIKQIKERTNDFGIRSFIPAVLSDRIKSKTNVLVITKAATIPFILTTQQNSLILPVSYPLSPGDHLLLTDCHQQQVITIKKLIQQKKQQIIIPNTELISFHYPLEIIPFEEIAYFIGKSTELNQQHEPIYTLHRKNLLNNSHTPDALLEGVEDLHLLFAVNINNRIEQRSATAITNEQQVRGVEVNLLLHSINSYYIEPHRYNFLDKSVMPVTRQLHKQWSFYTAIRDP